MSIDASIALFGSLGECKIESLDSDKKFCTGMFQNGIWEKRKSHIGTFVHCLHPMTIPYLSSKCDPSFSLSLPKLPIGIYNEILRFFRDIYNTIKSEVYVGVFWNLKESKYELYVPEQQVAGASISYKRNEGSFIDKNLVHVMDCHSHCNFGAGFSGTDTADEVSTKLFGVIGNILGNVSMAWRAGCNQKFVTLQFDDIFDKDSQEIFSVGNNILDKVKELKIAYPTHGYGAAAACFQKYPTTNKNTPTRFKPSDTEIKLAQSYQSLRSYYDVMDYDSPLDFYSSQFSEFRNTPLDKNYIWASPEYKDSFDDFIGALFNWVEESNYGLTVDSSNTRELIASFLDLISGMDEMNVNVLKHILNEFVNHMTVDSYHDLQQHFTYLM